MKHRRFGTGIKIGRLFLLTALAAALAGCGSSYNAGGGVKSAGAADAGAYENSEAVYEAAAVDTVAAAEEPEMYEADFAETGYQEGPEESVPAAERKLIKTVNLSVETETYDEALTQLEKQVETLGGYIEYQYQYNGSYYNNYENDRSASLTIRIPVQYLDRFVAQIGEQTNVTYKEEQVEDVTLRYVDLESRKKALETEQARLLELLSQAETVEDIITIEQRLSEVRYELESKESQLRVLDNQIDYSTIYLTIQEVQRLTPTEENSIWDKMGNGFIKSIYNIGNEIEYGFIRFVINIPYLIAWCILLLIAFLVIRVIWKRLKRKDAVGKLSGILKRSLPGRRRAPTETEEEEQQNKGAET